MREAGGLWDWARRRWTVGAGDGKGAADWCGESTAAVLGSAEETGDDEQRRREL